MSLDKAIEHGREKRRPYHGSKSFDYTCRNHGGKGKRHCGWQCHACLSNRRIQTLRDDIRISEVLSEENADLLN